jgi:hypothetical protein
MSIRCRATHPGIGTAWTPGGQAMHDVSRLLAKAAGPSTKLGNSRGEGLWPNIVRRWLAAELLGLSTRVGSRMSANVSHSCVNSSLQQQARQAKTAAFRSPPFAGTQIAPCACFVH